MTEQFFADEPPDARFALAGRNPDVLTCIANLSNDEVFTPPDLAKQMLDTLEEAWQARNGTSLWSDPTTTFLDPFTKSGVFLREITKRLVDGLVDEIPDLEDRVDHILTNQVYGIAITELTALIARRSLYCSKRADGEHSIAKSLSSEAGNIWFERTEHAWEGGTDWVLTADEDGNEVKKFTDGKCRFCRANQKHFDRIEGLETHAYAFIHTDDIAAKIANLFGENMKFDVIIGNPPYQLSDDGHGASASTIYHRFVEQAKRLEPRFLTMVTPSRWMAGGKGLDAFREAMLTGRQLRTLVDYPNTAEVFPSVDIKGGVSYFLWDSGYDGACDVTVIRGGESIGPHLRELDEYDVLIRDIRGLQILKKVQAFEGESLSEIVSARWAFGTDLTSNFSKWERTKARRKQVYRLYMQGGDRERWVDPKYVTRNEELAHEWKVLAPKAGPGNSGGHVIPDIVLGRPVISEPDSVCTLTYLVVGPLPDVRACESLCSYLRTRFTRFLVSLRKPSQDAPRGVYTWVPQQTWDREWTDEGLYIKYGLTNDEIEFIESVIRPMEPADA